MHNPVKINLIFKSFMAITVFLFLALLPLACQRESAGQAPQETPAKPAAPGKASAPQPRTTPAPVVRDFVLASSYTGEVKSVNRVDLTAKVAGRIKEVKVEVGDKVKKGDLLVELDHDVLDIQVKQAESALALAKESLAKMEEGSRKEQISIVESALRGTQAQLDTLLAGSTKEQIASAKAALDGKQAELDALLAGATAEDIRTLESQVRQAEAQLGATDVETARTLQTTRIVDTDALNYSQATRDSKIALDQVKVQVAKDQLAAKKAPPTASSIAKLKAAVDAARADLEGKQAPPRAEEIARLEASVAAARQQLEIAKNPFTAHDLEIARIGIRQAQSALDLAKTNRAEASLYSPFDGTISARIASEGMLASASSPLLTILSGDIHVSIAIEEAAVGKVKPDQIWDVKVLAYPDRVFKGKVKAISPALNPATRTFDILLAPQDADGLLLPGMFITASLPQQ